MYEEGCGVMPDTAEARKWYLRAADQGDDDAEYNLGALHERENAGGQGQEQALSWYRKAAGHGCRTAEERLALLS